MQQFNSTLARRSCVNSASSHARVISTKSQQQEKVTDKTSQ